MSQSISVIITKQVDAVIPDDIPHIIKNSQLLIALETGNSTFGYIMEDVIKSGNTNILDYTAEYSCIALAAQLGITSFVAYHYSDWADIPYEIHEFTVIDNIFIKDSFLDADAKEPNENYAENDAEKLLGIITDDAIEYRDYLSFKAVYEAGKAK
jgi:hypothetical protein